MKGTGDREMGVQDVSVNEMRRGASQKRAEKEQVVCSQVEQLSECVEKGGEVRSCECRNGLS